jgi:hypothetical protein
VYYGSEARGYAPAALFAVLAFRNLRNDQRIELGTVAWFGMWVIAGFLSHLSFVYVYLAMFGYSLYRLTKRRLSYASISKVATFHMLPLGMLLVLAWWVSKMSIGADREYAASSAALVAARELVGVPGGKAAAVSAALVLVGMAGYACMRMRSRGSDEWVFFLLLGIAPAVVLWWFSPSLVYPRYFFVLTPFALLLVAYALADLWARGKCGRLAAVCCVCLYALGQIQPVRSLLTDGRGQYQSLLSYVALETAGDVISIGGYDDGMVNAVLQHYKRTLPANKHLRFVPHTAAAEEFEWYVGGPDARKPAPEALRLVKVFPGMAVEQQWHLYRAMK